MGQVTTERFFQFRVLAYVDITQGYMNKKYDILTIFLASDLDGNALLVGIVKTACKNLIR